MEGVASEIAAQKQKGRPGLTGTPWKTTVAPVRRGGKELEGEPQSDADGAARLVPIGLGILAVHR
jgi:hypothetical protein